MGSIYKLRPEIKDFVIQQKEANPALGCRVLASMTSSRFRMRISKSHINSFVKQYGLSNGVGRPAVFRQGIARGSGLGAYMLKAADIMLGGTWRIAELLKNKLPADLDARVVCEVGVYASLFPDAGKEQSALWNLVPDGRKAMRPILSYLNEDKEVTVNTEQTMQLFGSIAQEARTLQLTLSNGTQCLIDPQMHTLWSAAEKIPYDLSAPRNAAAASYRRSFIREKKPFVLFSSPGYDCPPEAWFSLLRDLPQQRLSVEAARLIAPDGSVLDTLPGFNLFQKGVIVGLWPWQYLSCRIIEEEQHGKKWRFSEKKESYYLTEASVKITQQSIRQSITMRSIVIRREKTDKPLIILLTSLSKKKASIITIASCYLNKCPNIENSYHDFNRKVELYAYNSSARRAFSKDRLIVVSPKTALNELFSCYLRTLDAFVRWFFLPFEYKNHDLTLMRERFYATKVLYKERQRVVHCTFLPHHSFAFRKDLIYATDRMNEAGIYDLSGRRAWFFTK